jgi:hypothetical protein
VGAEFVDSFGNQIGGNQFLSTGSVTWLYTGSDIAQNFFLRLIYADLNGGSETVSLNSQVCNGYMPA